MSRPTKSLDPEDRMGVYTTLEDVPSRFRLHHHAARYDDEDVWAAFCEEYEYEQGSHARYEEEVDRAGRVWCTFMDGCARHHALATPEDVETWAGDLLREKSLRRSHDYFLRVRRFYDWLKWNTEYPHRYNPVLMAASEGEAAGRIWAYKTEQTEQRRRDYRRQTNE
jgi:hypothetical protein